MLKKSSLIFFTINAVIFAGFFVLPGFANGNIDGNSII